MYFYYMYFFGKGKLDSVQNQYTYSVQTANLFSHHLLQPLENIYQQKNLPLFTFSTNVRLKYVEKAINQ